ncbi:hypothetical protein ACJJIK_08120 [Microbulbifer sp. ZKSA006]|uniref:hypothetical protein n=1 Tax=Microbulbifer sp. ZKSA006 TaxID=3243390 RepID=UPI004038FEE9
MKFLLKLIFLLIVLSVAGGYYVYPYWAGDKMESVNINENENAEIDLVVVHPKFGAGVVIDIRAYEASTLIYIDFGSSGEKWLIPEMANIKLQN